MALTTCPACGFEVSETAPACPKCGRRVTDVPILARMAVASPRGTGWIAHALRWVGGGLVTLGVASIAMQLTNLAPFDIGSIGTAGAVLAGLVFYSIGEFIARRRG